MSEARGSILADIRHRLGPRTAPEDIAVEAAALVSEPALVQPKFPHATLIERFVAKATSERVTASLVKLDALAKLPQAVAGYMDDHALARRIAVQPTGRLGALRWEGMDLHHQAEPDEAVAVSLAEYGIAETGSVVLRSGKDAPVLLNFLPLHHLLVVEAGRILPHMEDLWQALGADGVRGARSINIITGTSGTADIEAINIRGAHGPKHMRIFVVEGG